MPFDGGHPALELVNTLYGAAGGPIEHDVLATPGDLVTFARRLGFADEHTPAAPEALTAAHALRCALDRALRAHLAGAASDARGGSPRVPAAGDPPAPGAAGDLPGRAPRAHLAGDQPPPAGVAAAAREAFQAAVLAPGDGAFAWVWDPADARTPVHRLAHAAAELLTDPAELSRLHQCDGCRWLFVDHSRGAGRRWCSMADCGTEAKKRRYVERRRAASQPRPASVDPAGVYSQPNSPS